MNEATCRFCRKSFRNHQAVRAMRGEVALELVQRARTHPGERRQGQHVTHSSAAAAGLGGVKIDGSRTRVLRIDGNDTNNSRGR